MADPVIDYDDVQGTILRGYRVDLARHFILSITNAQLAGQFVEALVQGSNGLPKITTARRTLPKPACFLNISFTCPGLAAMGLSAAQLASFDTSFQRGATSPTTAATVGDIGPSAPENWVGGLDNGAQVHVLLSLWVSESSSVLESVSAQLRAAFAGCMTELYAQDATALPDNKVHFGYRDSIAQPTVIGAPPIKRQVPDDQPAVATGEFLLGYLNETGGSYSVSPAELSTNSSYAAFRILEHKTDWNSDFDARQAAELLECRGDLLEKAEQLAAAGLDSLRIRIHGDFHLGQALVAQRDIYIVDFEGEPARSLAQRREKSSPLRDVAGLLRSFDYAAAFAGGSGQGDLGEAAEIRKQQILQQFAPTAGAVFWEAYQEAMPAGRLQASDDACIALLQLFVLEKAAYEVCYEAANRPTWISVPLNGMAAIAVQLLEPSQGEPSDD